MNNKILFGIIFLSILTYKSFGQISLDSLFFNIPFESNIIQTYKLLASNEAFRLLRVDTNIDHIDFVSFEVNKKFVLPTNTTAIRYQKNTPTVFADSLCKSCPEWQSTITLIYDSKRSRNANYKKLIKQVQNNFPKAAQATPTYNDQFHVHEFYLSDNKIQKVLSVSYGMYIETDKIYVSYY